MLNEFPQNFLWGAATSAHQVEGGNYNNDWWVWEQSHPQLESSGRACNHYNLFLEDFDLAKKLGHNAHRLSLEWSRIQPREGIFSDQETNHYLKVLRALKEHNFQVMLTLHHFTLPQWFACQGGFLKRNAPKLFGTFIEYVVKKFSDYVDFWITINEPNIYASNGFLQGKWPPGKKNLRQYLRVLNILAKTHRLAYQKIHALLPEAKVGIAQNYVFFEPDRPLLDKLTCYLAQKFWNQSFYQKTNGWHDFLGINYYFHNRLRLGIKPPFWQVRNCNQKVSDLDWEIYPNGLYAILLELQKMNLPIYITENGLADKEDKLRPQFIIDHLEAIQRACSDGVDVRGYFHWSLLDNFEWAHGFGPRFGLVAVDYQTQQRIPRPSAYLYNDWIKKSAKNNL